MGLISGITGAAGAARRIGRGVGDVAEVFVGNRAERDAAASRAYLSAVREFSSEFARASVSRFDAFVNALNRLPRPLMTLGTLGLFVFAMVSPDAFSVRMQGLALVPDPLWWLLGAIVSFYFGARELHYHRARSTLTPLARAAAAEVSKPKPLPVAAVPRPAPRTGTPVSAADPDYNPALEEWRRLRR